MTITYRGNKILPSGKGKHLICLSLVVAAIACLWSQQVMADEPLNAWELLDKYAATQDKLQSLTVTADNSSVLDGSYSVGEYKQYSGVKKNYSRTDLRFDGRRISYREHRWGDIGKSSIPENSAEYTSYLLDNKRFLQTTNNSARDGYNVMVSKATPDEQRTSKHALGMSSFKTLFGYIAGDNDQRIDLVLQKADRMSVREQRERAVADGPECYVIDAVGKRGKYTIWIDPEHGFNVAKANVEIGEGDIFLGEPVEKRKMSYSITVLDFKKINGIWIPVEADQKTQYQWDNGDYSNVFNHHKLNEIRVNPDHDALRSFVPDDIPNGSSVRYYPSGTIHFTWKDGEAYPEIDKSDLDAIVEEIRQIDNPDKAHRKSDSTATAQQRSIVASDDAQAKQSVARVSDYPSKSGVSVVAVFAFVSVIVGIYYLKKHSAKT